MNRRVPIVLLIEHDPIQSVTLARALKGGGYSVIPASRAPDALETFVTHHMDIAVVVADTQAATFGGLQLLSALGSIDPRVPVVAMSPAAAIAGGAAGYANVVTTLTKPVAPADLIDHVQRVLQSPCSRDQQASPPILDTSLAPDYDLASAELSPALRDWVDSLGDCTSFRWPPTEEELDDIQVLDTQACPPTPPTQSDRQPDRHLRLATPPAPPACPPAQLVRPVHFVKPVEPVEVATSTQLVRRAPLAPLMRLAPPMQLVVRRFDGLRRTRRFTFKWTDRWVAVAATALIGLTLTTLLEVRGVPAPAPAPAPAPVRRATVADNPLAAAPVAPVLLARRDHTGMMPLVPAERVNSRFDSRTRLADARPPERQPERLSSAPPRREARQRDRIPDAPKKVPRPAGAATPPPALAAARPRAPALAPTPTTAPAHHVEVADARIEPATARDAAVPTNAHVTTVDKPRDDERGIYQVLRQYERAYERLDVEAARAVWPSLNTRALARAFDGLKAQALELSHCRVAMASREATAICDGRASYVPRVGHQTARTEPREWTFRLRKVDQDWLIAKAEAR